MVSNNSAFNDFIKNAINTLTEQNSAIILKLYDSSLCIKSDKFDYSLCM